MSKDLGGKALAETALLKVRMDNMQKRMDNMQKKIDKVLKGDKDV